MKALKFTVWISSLLLLTTALRAEVRLAGIFSDHMVLQRDARIPIWGWGAPQETVTIHFAGKEYKTKVSEAGEWSMELPKHKAGGPYEMKVNQKILEDIYVGDVYLMSGQSNMELTVKRVMDKYKDEILSYENNLIRYTKTKYAYNFIEPQQNSENNWKLCNRKEALDFAALCYFFAKEMQAQERVAIGIINSSWGGTTIASWSTRPTLENMANFRSKFQSALYADPAYPDSVKKAEKAQTDLWYHLQSANDTGTKEKWEQAGFNDSDWEEVDVFNASWGGSWNKPANGVHYFRQRVEIPASLEGQKAVLRVGTMKDADATFVNGVCVGNTGYQYPPRIYNVPAGVLRAGENEIVIRLLSCNGRPAFVKGKPYRIEIGEQSLPLAATWKHKVGCILSPMPSSTSFQCEPTGLYNSMIHPLRNYAVRGAVWYQGESDTGEEASKIYESCLVGLINDWRKQWKKELPFVVVQLANYQQRSNKPIESGNAQVREAQRKATLRLKNVGLATAIDLGESNDIHPLNKKDLAHRCVLQMNKLAFGKKSIVAEGPMAEKAEWKGNGRIVISFRKGTGDLKQAEMLQGIAIAGKDGVYKFVEASTEGNLVVARWDGEGEPVSIRYAWENNPPSSIYNTEGLPASSFQLPVQHFPKRL